MKLHKVLYLLVLLSLLAIVPSPSGSQNTTMAAQPSDITGWETGPYPPSDFQYARHDGAFVPGPALAQWANKVYFPGGRTSPPTESPHIWMFDPVTNEYTDTGVDVVEDVSNYNANLVLDDGTGRGPAIYVIGGTDKDHGGASIGMVQRYYPMLNVAEALPVEDNWNGTVGGSRVAAIGTAVVDDVIYVYGGWETNVAPYFSAETWTFDPNLPPGLRWTNLGVSLSVPRSYIMSAVQDGKVYAIGGVGIYVGGELDPVDTVEVLDTTDLAAGWTVLAPLPTAGGEGRAFGFDSDTKMGYGPYSGKIYVVASNNWAAVSSEVQEYDVATDTWRDDLPELPTARADLAGSFIPLCTADPMDGMPGIWTFGGRVNESCDPPLGPVEYAPMTCATTCTELTDIEIAGPTMLPVGEVGEYTPTILPENADAPVSLLWSDGSTGVVAHYSWSVEGTYTISVTATNCDGAAQVIGTLDITVYESCVDVTGAEISGPASLRMGESGLYSVTLTPEGATAPFDIQWDNGSTGTPAEYSWDVGGLHTMSVTASNCSGSATVSDEFSVAVSHLAWLPMVAKPEAR